MSRARSKMGISEEETIAAEAAELEWVGRFLTSLEQGNVDHVLSLLTEDVMLVSDGRGQVIAATRPIRTRDHVGRFLLGGFEFIKPSGESSLRVCPSERRDRYRTPFGRRNRGKLYVYNSDAESLPESTLYETRISLPGFRQFPLGRPSVKHHRQPPSCAKIVWAYNGYTV